MRRTGRVEAERLADEISLFWGAKEKLKDPFDLRAEHQVAFRAGHRKSRGNGDYVSRYEVRRMT